MPSPHSVMLAVLLCLVVAGGQKLSPEMEDAIKRAPEQCKDKILAYHNKVASGGLKLDYERDPEADEECSLRKMQVGSGGKGVIMRLPDGQFEKATHHALHGVVATELTHKESEGLAFLILTHDKQTVAYLSRLIEALNKPGHIVLVHVDAKARAELSEFVMSLESRQGPDVGTVRLCRPAVEIAWAGATMLQAMLVGFRQLAEMAKTHPWGHAMVISGSDFPTKSVDHMSRLLKHFGPTSHFEIFHQLPEFTRARGLNIGWVECENFVYKVESGRAQVKGIELWGGSSWITLSRSFTEFLTSCLFEKSKRDPDNFFKTLDEASVPSECRTATNFLDYCENMLSAEEIYFHTVYMNTPHCQNIDTRYLRWVHWLQGRAGTHCGDLSDWCGKSPGYVESQQIRQALAQPAFFLRKLDPKDGHHLDYLEARIVNDTKVFALPFELGSATSSSHEKSMPPNLGIDKNDYTRWGSEPGSDKQWFQVTLERPYEVCGVSIAWESARPAEFSILSRKEKGTGNFQRAYAYSNANKNDPQARLDRAVLDSKESFPHHEVLRYDFDKKVLMQDLKLLFTKRATRWGYSFYEIEAHACSTA